MLAHTLQLWRIYRWPLAGHGRMPHGVSVALAEGSHPVPSRTRKLSPPAPMVLPGKLGGRVGRRRSIFADAAPYRGGVRISGLFRPDLPGRPGHVPRAVRLRALDGFRAGWTGYQTSSAAGMGRCPYPVPQHSGTCASPSPIREVIRCRQTSTACPPRRAPRQSTPPTAAITLAITLRW
jgi:hypothetical protein